MLFTFVNFALLIPDSRYSETPGGLQNVMNQAVLSGTLVEITSDILLFLQFMKYISNEIPLGTWKIFIHSLFWAKSLSKTSF